MRQAYDYWQDQPGSFLPRRWHQSGFETQLMQLTRRQALPSWRVSPKKSITFRAPIACSLSFAEQPALLPEAPPWSSRAHLAVRKHVLVTKAQACFPLHVPLREPSLTAEREAGMPSWFSPRLTGYACASRIDTSLSAALQLEKPKLKLEPSY